MVAPAVGRRLTTRRRRDQYVRLDANDSSVHPSAVGRHVEVSADVLTVHVSCDGKPVGRHNGSVRIAGRDTEPRTTVRYDPGLPETSTPNFILGALTASGR
jgi:hypothetical protein